MRLSISNIAWDVAEDDVVAGLLKRHDVDAIDIAPGKYFPDPPKATDSDIRLVRRYWSDRGFDIVGMQALLFGTQGLNLFGTMATRDAMLSHLAAVCRIGSGLGARKLVFGSPRNRDRAGLDDDEASVIATSFFRRLGDVAAELDLVVCLEPNPPRYGANYLVTASEVAGVVAGIDHPAIRMQFDTGAIAITGEDPGALLGAYAPLVAHVHASEPDLVPLGDGGCDHESLGALFERWLSDRVVTIEMLATTDEPHAVAIERALAVAGHAYRRTTGAST